MKYIKKKKLFYYYVCNQRDILYVQEAHNDAEAAEIEIINIDIQIACDKLVSGNVGILSSFS